MTSPERAAAPEPAAAPGPAVVVYRRSGCGFCLALRRKLRRAGLEHVEVDIWDDPDAAAFVRAHAGGSETVPTVDVAGTVMVNPSARRVLDAARAAGLDVPEPPPPWWRRGGSRGASAG